MNRLTARTYANDIYSIWHFYTEAYWNINLPATLGLRKLGNRKSDNSVSDMVQDITTVETTANPFVVKSRNSFIGSVLPTKVI